MTTTISPWSRSPAAAPETGGGPQGGALVVTFVVAVADNGVIGRDGDLPWRLSSDLKMFRRLTMGKPIVMGRRTWQSLPKRPLDGRDNIVVTRDETFQAEGARVVHDPQAALVLAGEFAILRGVDEIAVIGGAALYSALLAHAGRIYWTAVAGTPEGDTSFPDFDPGVWRLVSEEPIARGPNDEFTATLRVLERVPSPRG